jgi:GNAT superfamily N-acetyltransferase
MQLNSQPAHGRYQLRLADDADMEFLWQLKLVTLREYITQIFGWDEALARTVLERHWHGSHIVLLDAERVGQIKVTEGPEGWVYLAEILLLPAYQRRGLGTCIVQDVIDVAERAGCNLELQVLSSNPARRLYERLGFRVTHYKMYRPKSLA